ncbi:hypothetical protein GCK72_000917 [Caenorhabditis remanei]|uniref:Uncharacterized protein n=1 Tax=Caenorhabditis remanei TaxID=31234 RepID=A0A6A5HR58_CAERE|nr:hypothetical protein GCK72_000917 [Caenorhabditis remanei]KAF1769104.1 hypothetical protein GCK72_000917 [Caenorhabditis remanei]
MEFNEKKPKFQQNVVSNLLDREIGTEYRKYATNTNTYRHPYQLLTSTKPDTLVQIDLDKCDKNPDSDQPPFSLLADCLGFSPDGKYLAFHSHARSFVSIFRYTGAEGGKCAEGISNPQNYLREAGRLDLSSFTRDYNYENERMLGSWWTDDSKALIIQLSMESSIDDEDQVVPEDEDVLQLARQLVEENRNTYPEGDMVGNFVNERRRRLEILRAPAGEGFRDDDLYEEVRYNVYDNTMRPNPECYDADAEIDYGTLETLFKQHTNGIMPENELTNEISAYQHRETSRTIPFTFAMESAARMRVDSFKKRGQTSRTMPVYHALTRSIRKSNYDGYSTDSSDSSDSSDDLHRDQLPASYSYMQESDATRMLAAEEKLKKLQKMNCRCRICSKREVSCGLNGEKKVIVCTDYWKKWTRKYGANLSGLGYSRPDAYIRRKHGLRNERPTVGAYRDRLRKTLEDLDYFHKSYLTASAREERLAGREDRVQSLKVDTMLVLAFEIEEDTVCPLYYNNISSKFLCHVRDRTMTICCNNDTIEIYHYSETTHIWEQQEDVRHSQNESYLVPLDFRVGTMPGQPSRNEEPEMGEIFDDLFESDYFYSPVQQDTLTLLHRDMPEVFDTNDALLKGRPRVFRCHALSDDLIAVSLKLPWFKPMYMGMIISPDSCNTTLYPDYHEFLKLLFANHLPELLPRAWTYFNPYPAKDQPWFKKEIINVSDPRDLNDYELLRETYEFLSKHWNNLKSTSNPLNDSLFNSTHAYQFFSKFVFTNGNRITFNAPDLNKRKHLDVFCHPKDPFAVVNNTYNWFFGIRKKDQDDVIVGVNPLESDGDDEKMDTN